MIGKLKNMVMSGLKMLTTKKGMLAAILFGASAIGMAVNPEIASSLAEHLSALLDMAIDMINNNSGDPVGGIPTDTASETVG